MKNIKTVLAFVAALVLSSCLDTEEKIVLNADNSGIYSMTIDLGRMLKMSGALGADRSNPGNLKEKKDTTIYLKNLVDTAANLTAAEKALYKDGIVHINMDEEKNEMKIEISSPFKNTADLTEMKNNFSTVLSKLKAFEKAAGENGMSEEDNDDMKTDAKSTNPVGEQFTFMAGPGKISNTITDIDAFKKLVTMDSTLSMMTQMTSLMGDFNYRTIIILPKIVKKYSGPGSSLSTDKKTVTFFTTLTEMMEHPENVSYAVEY